MKGRGSDVTTRRQKISVRVERVVYPKVDEDLGGAAAFHIFRTDAGTCKGKLSHRPKPGEVLELDGAWGVSKWNGQPEFSFIHADVCVPNDERAMLKYACEMTSGLGPASEEAIWAALGEKWREISVGDVRGVSPQKVCALQETVSFIETHAEKAETVAWLMSVGCTFGMAEAAFAKWKGRTREVVNEDCYRLASLPHYSFRDVDEHVRAKFGIGRDDPRRVDACLLHYVRMLTESDTVALWVDVYAAVARAIDASPEAVTARCAALFRTNALVPFKACGGIARASDFEAEAGILDFALRAADGGAKHVRARQPKVRAFDLDDAQMDAVQNALDRRLSVINGGAGCGKTTLIQSVCESLEADGARVNLCAFAGKAAARLKEATCHDASTIHRMLCYSGEERGFTLRTLRGVSVVLDEASMVSSDLMWEIVKRGPDRLVLVGDEAQLPPVGSGQPFHDLIKACPSCVRTLSRCYRSREAVFSSALAIRNGHTPPREAKSENERFAFVSRADGREAHGMVLEAVRAGKVDFGRDVVLCCRNGEADGSTPCSVIALNRDIKDIVNPNARTEIGPDGRPREAELTERERYRVAPGDRVINTKNDAANDVWNGTTGTCARYDSEGAMWVDLDYPRSDGSKTCLVQKRDAANWQLAYALTVHKAQGSQYRRVLFLVTRRDENALLTRPMVYTAVTRAKRECVVVGDFRAFSVAVARTERKRTVIQTVMAEKGAAT